jgi:hypothetical protein
MENILLTLKKEWNSVHFSSYSLYDANCPFWPKLLPALVLKKPWYPCPFEILAEASTVIDMCILHFQRLYQMGGFRILGVKLAGGGVISWPE